MRRFLLAFALVFAWIGPGFSAQRLAQVNPSTNQSFLAESFWANASPVFYANLAATNSVPPGLVYASAGPRWCWNSTGALVQLAANAPCFDYNPTTLTPLGARNEPLRTNYVPASNSTTGWVNTGGSLSTSAVVAPAGDYYSLLTDNAINSNHTARINFSIPAGNTITASVIVKNNTGRWLEIIVDDGSSNGITANFDLVSGTTSGTFNQGSGVTSASSMVSVGGGAYRIAITGIPSSGTAITRLALALNNSATAAWYPAYVGTGTGVYFSVVQVEKNPFATSPILTYGSAVTVLADQWSFTGAALAALQAPTTCHVIEFTPEGVNSTLNPLIKSNTTGSFGSAFVPSLTEVALANVTSVAATSAVPSAGVKNRVAAAGAPGAYAVAVNGVLGTGTYAGAQTPGSAYGLGAITGAASSMWVSQIAIRSRCTATQARRYSTAGVNLLASLADNDNLPLVVKIASGEW